MNMAIIKEENEDLDYAAGYYDGIQGMPVLGFSISYKRGYEDGKHDSGMITPVWSEWHKKAVQAAYEQYAAYRDNE